MASFGPCNYGLDPPPPTRSFSYAYYVPGILCSNLPGSKTDLSPGLIELQVILGRDGQ